MNTKILILVFALFLGISFAVKPNEEWKNEYKTCIYEKCKDTCYSSSCEDCSKTCKSQESSGYHGTLMCLKSCKDECTRLKSQDCDKCKLMCKDENLPKRTDADIEAYRSWKQECKENEMCGWDCTKDWKSEMCKKCRKVFC